ncbi:hypothetical protein [Nocardiopsis kunsanensis]|uniref:hypothetical protein n=1 Tax=Nocardiopsis kunsanensis TaxID=141693 RepID=UPI001E3A4E17|nr:hypothetical protein [Nocardiopsis kunsanensis]
MVIAGEDSNDRESLKTLLEEKHPALRGSIVQIRDTVRLHKATGENLAKRVRSIINKAKGVAEKQGPGTRVACLYVHEDFDAVDGPAYVEAHRRVEQEIHHQTDNGHYVLAVAEMEAWMLLFPEALPTVVKTWKLPTKYVGRDTGRLPTPRASSCVRSPRPRGVGTPNPMRPPSFVPSSTADTWVRSRAATAPGHGSGTTSSSAVGNTFEGEGAVQPQSVGCGHEGCPGPGPDLTAHRPGRHSEATVSLRPGTIVLKQG